MTEQREKYGINKPDFVTELTRELRAWQDETQWLQPYHIREMLARAAGRAVSEPSQDITLIRRVSPDEMKVEYILEIEGGPSVLLWPDDIATLRAVLMTVDENAPVALGEPLAMPCKLSDGRVVSVVVEEMLEDDA